MKLSKIYLALLASSIAGYALAEQSTNQSTLDVINVVATRDPSKFADNPQKQAKIISFLNKLLALLMR